MVTRRSVLHGATLSLAAPLTGAINSRFVEMREQWTRVSTPTSNTLQAAADTATGHFAAGGNGVLIERTGDGWETALESGPAGNGNNLTALATTADGERLWLAGASGALGVYDVRAGTVTDRTAPDGVTNNFTAIAVTGSAGDATVSVADASGKVHVSRENGRPGSWNHVTPGSGAAIQGFDFYGATAGVLVDGNQDVFETTDGTDWTRIGIDDADGSFAAVDANGSSEIWVVGDTIRSRSDDGWTRPAVAHKPLRDVAVCWCGCVHAVGASGTILHRPADEMEDESEDEDDSGGDSAESEDESRDEDEPGHEGESEDESGDEGESEDESGDEDESEDDWRKSSPTGENLHGIALGWPHVAVGASGVVLER